MDTRPDLYLILRFLCVPLEEAHVPLVVRVPHFENHCTSAIQDHFFFPHSLAQLINIKVDNQHCLWLGLFLSVCISFNKYLAAIQTLFDNLRFFSLIEVFVEHNQTLIKKRRVRNLLSTGSQNSTACTSLFQRRKGSCVRF